MTLQGIYAEITTPFDETGRIFSSKLEHNVEKWNRVGLAGYAVCGAAGEGALLDAEETLAVLGLVAKFAAPGRTLIAATARAGVHETVALTNRAADLGYRIALIDAPAYAPDTLSLYLRAVADRTKIPLVVRGAAAPGHANIARAAVEWQAESLWEGLRSGAQAAVLNFAAAAPYAAITIWEAHRTREEEAGLDWQSRIRAAAELTARYGAAGVKHAMDLNGYYGGPPRLPFTPLNAAERGEIERAFRDLKG
jgi:4-hydroxy-2-oxoglutarate aldolase